MLVYDRYVKIHREETPTGQSLTDWNVGKNDDNFLKDNGRCSVNKTILDVGIISRWSERKKNRNLLNDNNVSWRQGKIKKKKIKTSLECKPKNRKK